ncbi:hypothetical protein [Halobacillus faecis]|uniref:Uncharacterized protein n=1 Tax=Halobacillus faecis TaxID=360184 RepID=A0A511WL91_9BACI|nr:hypothetical protein [Halobacillus faecis]GEN51910.1 hypothetical protein HFA01_01720 [Halobacillus faecis]
MTDLLIWLATIAIAFIILRYIPLQLAMKGRMILWLTGALISSLALLATITYTFWMGIFAVLTLGVVCAILLQEKASHVFEDRQELTSDPSGVQKSHLDSGGDEEVQPNESGEGHILEDEDLSEVTPPLSDRESQQEDHSLYEDYEKKEEQKGIPAIEVGDEKSLPYIDTEVDLDEHNEVIQENEQPTSNVQDIEMLDDKLSYTDDADEGFLLDEEIAQLRIKEESIVIGEGLEESEVDTEEELMAERNLQLDIGENAFGLEPVQVEELPNDMEDIDDRIEEENIESEEDVMNEINKPTDSDKDITREMTDQEKEIPPSNQEEHIQSSTNYDLESDIEDNEDSLALKEGPVEILVADETLRKQLLDLMIKKIEYMEAQMTGVEYENCVKAHLSENLPDLEYYSVSKYLIKYYIKYEKSDELELFVGELIERFASYSLLVEELRYVLKQQGQFIKQ